MSISRIAPVKDLGFILVMVAMLPTSTDLEPQGRVQAYAYLATSCDGIGSSR